MKSLHADSYAMELSMPASGDMKEFTVVAAAAVTGSSLRLHRLDQADSPGHCLWPRHPPELAEHEAGRNSAAPGVPCSLPP